MIRPIACVIRLLTPMVLLCFMGCGVGQDREAASFYRERHGAVEVYAVTSPDHFVGRAPAMSPERARQEAHDAEIRRENPQFFSPTGPPPAGTRAIAEFEYVDAVHVAFDETTEEFLGDLLPPLLSVAPVVITSGRNGGRERFDRFFSTSGLDGQGIKLLDLDHDEFWTRDFGPVVVELPDGRPGFVDFRYPQTRVLDDGIPSALAATFRVPAFRAPINFEGGVFMTNGDGLCITTTSLAVSNPDVPFGELTQSMGRLLGCTTLVFLESPPEEVTGHVDMFAKFTGVDTLLLGSFDPEGNPSDAAVMDRNNQLLESIRLGFGSSLEVVRIPMPKPEGTVYRSYTNSLLVNGTAVVPVYGDDPDREEAALESYRRALPEGWRIVTVDSSSVIDLGGAVHCAALGLRFSTPH